MAVGKANKSALSAASFDTATVKEVQKLRSFVASGEAKRPAAKAAATGYATGRAKAQGATFGQLRTGRFASAARTGNAETRGAQPGGHVAAGEHLVEIAKRDPDRACNILKMIAQEVVLKRKANGLFG